MGERDSHGSLDVKSRALHIELSMQRLREDERARGERLAGRRVARANESFVAIRQRLATETRGGSDAATVRAANALVGQLVEERRGVTTAERELAIAREAHTDARNAVAGTTARLERLREILARRRAERVAEQDAREIEAIVEARVGRNDASVSSDRPRGAEERAADTPWLSESTPWVAAGIEVPRAFGGGAAPMLARPPGTFSTERVTESLGDGRPTPRTETPNSWTRPAGITAVRPGEGGHGVGFTFVGSGGATIEVDLARRAGGGLDVVITPERLRDRHRLWDERFGLRRALTEQGYTVHGVRIAGAVVRGKEDRGDD